MAPGADAMLATCISMSAFYLAKYHWGPAPQRAAVEEAPLATTAAKPFCAQRTHDFAVQTADTEFAVSLLQAEQWEELATALAALSNEERQGFYANFDYGRLTHVSSGVAACTDTITDTEVFAWRCAWSLTILKRCVD